MSNGLSPIGAFWSSPYHQNQSEPSAAYMDSHACTTESRPGFHYDGKLILTEDSRPGQIPYCSLLPRGADNLLVPVCLSATHIAWGAVRLMDEFGGRPRTVAHAVAGLLVLLNPYVVVFSARTTVTLVRFPPVSSKCSVIGTRVPSATGCCSAISMTW